MSLPASCFIQIEGEPFHYLDFGGEGLPPLVFVHGTGFHAWLWAPYGEALKSRFHCYAVDQRWHGDSTRAARPYDWIHNGDDLAAFTLGLGLDRPLFVGHSMGCVSIAFAEVRRPGTVARAVFVDPIIMAEQHYTIPYTLENHTMAARTLKRRTIWDSHEQMISSYAPKSPFKSWRPEFLDLYVHHGVRPTGEGAFELKCLPEHEANVYLHGNRNSPWPHLAALPFPALIVRPLASDTVHIMQAKEVARRMPRAELVDVETATHYLPMEQPEILIELIEKFDDRTRLAAASSIPSEADSR